MCCLKHTHPQGQNLDFLFSFSCLFSSTAATQMRLEHKTHSKEQIQFILKHCKAAILVNPYERH